MEEDQELWNRLRVRPERDESALAELRDLLFRGLRAGLSGRAGADEAFLEDVVQTSLIKILEKLEHFQGRSRFSTWVITIALRTAFSHLRSKHWKTESLEQHQEEGNHLALQVGKELDPYQDTARNHLIETLHHLIQAELTERQRVVLEADLKAEPQNVIAARLGIPRNAVYKLGHDARKALKRALERRGYRAEDIQAIFNNSHPTGIPWH